jgi:hypothetical protein
MRAAAAPCAPCGSTPLRHCGRVLSWLGRWGDRARKLSFGAWAWPTPDVDLEQHAWRHRVGCCTASRRDRPRSRGMKATFAGTFAFKVISMNMTAQASPAGFKGETASDVERFELHAEKLPSMGAFRKLATIT